MCLDGIWFVPTEEIVMETQEVYQKAKARVEAKIGFYVHLGVYVVVNLLLLVINLTVSSQYYWAKWPLMGWGLAVALHALNVFVFTGNAAIKEQMIEKEIAKETADQQ